MRKAAFMRWINDELAAEPRLAQAVDDLLAEMKLEQQIAALREARGLSQTQLARLLGTSQPYVAKLESGRVKNLSVKTLAKCARALGASLSISIEPAKARFSPTRNRITRLADVRGRVKWEGDLDALRKRRPRR